MNQVLTQREVVLEETEIVAHASRSKAKLPSYGPLDSYLKDETITEIMVNGPSEICIERDGKIFKTDAQFMNEDHLMQIIEEMVSPLGRRVDEESPMVDGRLPDGSRINAVIPPLSLVGPVLTVRKFAKRPYTAKDLISFGTFPSEIADFLDKCVKGRLNIVISGGTGSGKTTLLNVLSNSIPEGERIVCIEDCHELQLRPGHVILLEKRTPDIEGKGEVTVRQLVINALRMRPDRIIVGEVRGGECFDMMQAMNTGHDGSLTTVHSNCPRDTLRRLENMVLIASLDLPVRAIREQVSSSIDLIIHMKRLCDGVRRVVDITEVIGMEGDVIVLQEIFKFQQEGEGTLGEVHGSLCPSGVRPKFSQRLEAAGLNLPYALFDRRK